MITWDIYKWKFCLTDKCVCSPTWPWVIHGENFIVKFQWKSSLKKLALLTENEGVTHGENILWTKTYITSDIGEKVFTLK